jgi:CMP-2-keto-3-deoxyoctulosonic acid synthetase
MPPSYDEGKAKCVMEIQGDQPFMSSRAMTMRWISLVPS